jgi:hypothetical protein
MASISVGAGIAAAGALSAGASVIGGSQAAAGSKQAAQLQQQTQTINALRAQPYVALGDTAASQLDFYNTNGFTAGQPNYLQMSQDALPGQMTQAQLEQTPGYQWQLNQGLQATQNAVAAKGLGVSGAALKGAATYATGLADANYQTQFNNAQTRSQDFLNLNTGQQGNAMNLFNRLADTTKIGANSAAGVGTNATAGAATQGGFIQGAGNASAAGSVGVGTAATGSAQNFLLNNLLQQQINNQNGSGAIPSSGDFSAAANSSPFALGGGQFAPISFGQPV